MEYISAGPGCSSFGIGAFQEIGPFRVDTDGKTLCNFKYAWNTGHITSTYTEWKMIAIIIAKYL